MVSYPEGVITLKMCWKVTFGHSFENNFSTVRNFWMRPNVLESINSEHEFELKFCNFSMDIKRVIVVWICPSTFPDIQNPIMCQRRGVKMEVKRFTHEFGFKIFFLYHEINNLEIKFWGKKNVRGKLSTWRNHLEMCWKVTFGHRFTNNFRMVRNF